MTRANEAALKSFYVILKDLDNILHFVFLTGTTKFRQTTISSALNNMVDITSRLQFSGVCGFTLKEFDMLFSEFLPDLLVKLKDEGDIDPTDTVVDLRNRILDWDDGYTCSNSEHILNHFSILNFFASKLCKNC